eukprot:TRINITY_DN3645_c0_g1_i1.p1 TRINITY_DN3645_c0_g1~~TRINITY_DN3645_c0_g1_i1.p1  ORF type:complete len:602 (+),score=183.30 TRINITY_DN3645_c0_g1_i1:268-2073(+)
MSKSRIPRKECFPALLEDPNQKKRVRPGDRVWIRVSEVRVGYGYVIDTIDETPKVPERFGDGISYTYMKPKNVFVLIAYGGFRGWFMASSMAWGRIHGTTKEELKKFKEKQNKLHVKEELEEILKQEEEEALRGVSVDTSKSKKDSKDVVVPRTMPSITSDYRKFLQEKAMTGPSISDLAVLEVIRSQKRIRKARRRSIRRDQQIKEQALDDLLGFSSKGASNWKGADDDPSDDAMSMMSEIDLESSISWTPDLQQPLRKQDEAYHFDIDDRDDEDQTWGDGKEGEDKEDEGYNAEEPFEDVQDVARQQFSEPTALQLSQTFLDFNVAEDKSSSRKLLSSMGFVGFDDDADDDNTTHTATNEEKKEIKANPWASGKNFGVTKPKRELEPELQKLQELLRFGFINEQQFQALEKEAKEEIERRKAAYLKEKDRRKRIAKKKKKAKLRAVEARAITEEVAESNDSATASTTSNDVLGSDGVESLSRKKKVAPATDSGSPTLGFARGGGANRGVQQKAGGRGGGERGRGGSQRRRGGAGRGSNGEHVAPNGGSVQRGRGGAGRARAQSSGRGAATARGGARGGFAGAPRTQHERGSSPAVQQTD